MAIGYDEGTVAVKISSDESRSSVNNGKLIYAKNYEIFTHNLKAIPKDDLKDDAIIMINAKELGTSDVYPLTIKHSYSGQSFVITDQCEYVIYKTQTFSNLSFGTGSNFVWSKNGEYAVKKDTKIAIYDSNHTEQSTIRADYPIEDLFGGPLLGVRSSDFVLFYDWETCNFISKIDVTSKDVYWNNKTWKQLIISLVPIFENLINTLINIIIIFICPAFRCF